MKTRTWAEISLSAIEKNFLSIKNALPETTAIAGVVKANAYGHGAVKIAELLQQKALVKYLAVACLDEAVELREAKTALPILIMGYTSPALSDALREYNISQAVGCIADARQLAKQGGKPIKIHIKIDTGMGRLGFDPESESFEADISELKALEGLEIEGIFTHFAVSDEPESDFTPLQFSRFERAVKMVESILGRAVKIKHCGNSGAVVNYKELSMDMVRPGIASYGAYSDTSEGGIALIPAMTLKTRIAAISWHKPGDTIGYGRTHTITERRKIAALPIGYADGLLRSGSNKYEFYINGFRARQVGRVCMDICMIDVTEIPDCKLSDEVIIFGNPGENKNIPTAVQQAKCAGTISYELLCAVSRRVPRIYTD
ncbi:alanine racemase [Clostridiaceae bacterium OttesenSCG-928-D20]|nr:alanine racemase [Clostridiaceae bacterium OttesenSCG-928-D20]